MDVPCLVKWIGSKRIQSEEIVQYFPNFIDTYYEPFCGGCSVLFQLLSSPDHYVNQCICSDVNGDLIDLWNTVKRDPDGLYEEYVRMWTDMGAFEDKQDKRRYFEMIREEFNQTRSPYCYFFLLRTCTNGIPRYNKYGQFNNTLHLTRDGVKPKIIKKIIYRWSTLLNEKNVIFKRCDYKTILDEMGEDDFAYLDPPYEMTRSTGKYFGKIDYQDMIDRLRLLKDRGVKFALSFDSTDDDLIIPGDCYENHINITSKNSGYRRTLLRMDSKDVYESLYTN